MDAPREENAAKPDAESGSYGSGPKGEKMRRGRSRLTGRSSYPSTGNRRSGRRVSRGHRRKTWIFRFLLLGAASVIVWIVVMLRTFRNAPPGRTNTPTISGDSGPLNPQVLDVKR